MKLSEVMIKALGKKMESPYQAPNEAQVDKLAALFVGGKNLHSLPSLPHPLSERVNESVLKMMRGRMDQGQSRHVGTSNTGANSGEGTAR